MELTDGVHALELHYELDGRELTIHPAAVETDRGIVLVDVGLPGSADRIDEALSAAGAALSDVGFVLVTHHDGDHVGALAEVVDRTSAVVLAHPDETPYVDGREDPVKGDPEDRPTAVPVDLEAPGGTRVRTRAGPMELIETPGHSPGHVSAYFPAEGLLLAGDAMVAEDGRLGGFNREYTPDGATATDSIGRLAELSVERTLCYHGGPVEHGAGRIAEIHEDLTT